MSSLYFDNNATTMIDERVLEVMLPCMKSQMGNPSSNHSFGRDAKKLIDNARNQVAESVGAYPKEVFFTSSGTESNNWFVDGMSNIYPEGQFFYGATEHPCISKPMQNLKLHGVKVEKLRVKTNGVFDMNELNKLSKNEINILSLMLVNNESGVINDIANIREQLSDYNIIFHSDAVQALGKIPLDFHALGLDAMSISSHKINGPQGIAALVIKNGLDIDPLILGGGQEAGLRSGTENLASIVGFGMACELSQEKLKNTEKLKENRNFFEVEIKSMGATIFSEDALRVDNTSFFGFEGIDGATMITALDKFGIGIASGSACSTNNKEASHVLTEMNVDPDLAQSAIRLSLNEKNTRNNILYLLEKIEHEKNRLKNYASLLN